MGDRRWRIQTQLIGINVENCRIRQGNIQLREELDHVHSYIDRLEEINESSIPEMNHWKTIAHLQTAPHNNTVGFTEGSM